MLIYSSTTQYDSAFFFRAVEIFNAEGSLCLTLLKMLYDSLLSLSL
jgi:hypothetical protein